MEKAENQPPKKKKTEELDPTVAPTPKSKSAFERKPVSPKGSTDQQEVTAVIATGMQPDTNAVAFEPENFPIVWGKFELLKELGKGGMGVVFLARQLDVDRLVALKFIRVNRLSGLNADEKEEAIERFRIESRAAARLDHEHLATVYEVGDRGGQPYYAMQYVEGETLAQLCRENPLPSRRAARYIHQAALALSSVHQEGVLHRDLKPQNIIVDSARDEVRLIDFGLAKLLELKSTATIEGMLAGSPPYMSPEQTDVDRPITEQSDIYNLGATLYHLMTGRPPFQASTLAETCAQVQQQDPVAPSLLNPTVEKDLEAVCLKCLEKEPERRFESAAALASDLQRFLDGVPTLSRPVTRFERLRKWRRRNPKLAGVGVLLALSLFIGTTSSIAFGLWALSEAETARQ